MTLKEYYSKDKHTRKENKWYNNIMRKKYEKYKKAYHEGKIMFRQRFAEKMTFADFKYYYKEEYLITEGKGTLKAFTDVNEMRELSDYSYNVKYENFLRNQRKYEMKLANGEPLTEGELEIVNYKFPRREIIMSDKYALVNYFDRLGLASIAFDSK